MGERRIQGLMRYSPSGHVHLRLRARIKVQGKALFGPFNAVHTCFRGWSFAGRKPTHTPILQSVAPLESVRAEAVASAPLIQEEIAGREAAQVFDALFLAAEREHPLQRGNLCPGLLTVPREIKHHNPARRPPGTRDGGLRLLGHLPLAALAPELQGRFRDPDDA